MKKVLFVITKSNFGGAQRYVYELATRLPKDQFETSVALGGEGSLKTKLQEANIPMYSMDDAQRDIDVSKEGKVLWRLIRIFDEVKPDVVHLNSPKIGGLGALAARLCGVKQVIYTNHGWPFKEERPEWQLLIIKLLSWITIFFSTKTIVLSEKEKSFVENWPFIKDKIVVIPNGQQAFEPLSKQDALTALIGKSKADHIFEEDIKVLGTISELHKNKGLNFAIEGFAEYADERMVFVVIGEGEERARLEQQIEELGLTGKVFLVGHIENARNYLAAFDYFLLASIKEGMPYAILEAGSLAIPVIATSVGGIPEVVENLKEGLIISPRRTREIKHALIYIREHSEDVDNYAHALQEKIRTVYSFEGMLQKIQDLYQK